MIQHFFKIIVISTVVFTLSCNKQEQYGFDENDTIRGIWGQTILYNEYGLPLQNNEGIIVTAHCIDTLGTDNSGNAIVLDTILSTTTDSKGMWQYNNAPGGLYYIEFWKEGFCKNSVYNYIYDTLRADTLDMLYLSQKPQASIIFDSVSVRSSILYLSRTVSFTSSNTNNYMLSTWYFFDTTAQVSSTKHMYAYMSGAAIGKGGIQQSFTTKKPLDKLYENGFKEGTKIYVTCAVDNAKYVQYYDASGTIMFPNISQLSAVKTFIMPKEN